MTDPRHEESEEIRLVGRDDDEPDSTITEPGKLIRLGTMLRALQEELRADGVDVPSRERLGEVHQIASKQISEVISGPVREELESFSLPFADQPPTESELRVAQAQLVGWLEGLFQGIQLALARQGKQPGGPPQPPAGSRPQQLPGQYM